MNIWLAVFLGGGIGSLMRYGISRLVLALEVKGAFPWATLVSNVVSAVILAWMILLGAFVVAPASPLGAPREPPLPQAVFNSTPRHPQAIASDALRMRS